MTAALISLVAVWTTAAPSPEEGADTFARLQHLIDAAPARQVGQDGNDVVDRWVHQRFEQLVRTHNDPVRQAEADRAVQAMEKADAALGAALDYHEQLAAGDRLVTSPWFIRFTLEEPFLCVVILLILAVLFFVGWFQAVEGGETPIWNIGIWGSVISFFVLVVTGFASDRPNKIVSAGLYYPCKNIRARSFARFQRWLADLRSTDPQKHALVLKALREAERRAE